MNCPLCKNNNLEDIQSLDQKQYFKCLNCYLIFQEKNFHLSKIEEKKRYKFHQNSIEDKDYVKFLNQAISPSLKYLNSKMVGLDFGCGPSPTLSKILEIKNINCLNYDLYFYPEFPKNKFDFIFSTECFEHFRSPNQEINKILSLLNKSGLLIVMTSMWNENIDFKNWYYIKDPTHIAFYHKKTFELITNRYSLEILEITEKVVILKFI